MFLSDLSISSATAWSEGKSFSANWFATPPALVCNSARVSLNLSEASVSSGVTPDSSLPRATIFAMPSLPSASRGAADCHFLPKASAATAALSCGSSMETKTSASCLKASSGSFAVIPIAANFLTSFAMLTESLLIDWAVPSRSLPDCVAASFNPASSPTANPVDLLRSLIASAASIAPFI